MTSLSPNPKQRWIILAILGTAQLMVVLDATGLSGFALAAAVGGALTQALRWRYCMYVNLVFAAVAGAGAMIVVRRAFSFIAHSRCARLITDTAQQRTTRAPASIRPVPAAPPQREAPRGQAA